MAFRTNKVPAIEERTVSGSSVSFNSAFALPLKACKVSFSATQASGTPSPSNPLPISGVSAIGLTANSTPVSVSLGDTRYGGWVNLLTGKGQITHSRANLKNLIWTTLASGRHRASVPDMYHYSTTTVDGMCNEYKPVNNEDVQTVDYSISAYTASDDSRYVQINDSNLNGVSSTTFTQAMSGVYFVYQLETPINIQLSANELSLIIGNNTFSTDTGTLEITFADLQEKSASGAVATFNTALAMPLVSCKTEFMCTQASGTPSPSNPLAITGVDKVAIQHIGGYNLWNEQWELGSYWNDTGLPRPLTDRIRCKDAIPVTQNTEIYTPYDMAFMFYDKNNNILPSVSRTGYSRADNMYIRQSANTEGKFLIPNGACYMKFYMAQSYGTTYNNDVSINVPSTDKSYHPYISNTVTFIDLNGTRYGGYVDVVRGKLVVDKALVEYDGSSDEDWYLNGSYGVYTMVDSNYRIRNLLVNKYKFSTTKASGSALSNNECCLNTPMASFLIRDDNALSVSAFKSALSNLPMQVVFSMVTPIEISLSDIPTLSTIIGNNTIFADTGDVDLTFKDLDIAKRGNFREVFKLPS